MEALPLVLNAIIAGAAAALKPTAGQAVKDAYEGLKALIKNRWSRVQFTALEQDPTSDDGQALVKKGLKEVGDLHDREVLAQAVKVCDTVKQEDPAAAEEAGIAISDLDAGASINIDDLIAHGRIDITRIKAAQDINIKGLRSTRPTTR